MAEVENEYNGMGVTKLGALMHLNSSLNNCLHLCNETIWQMFLFKHYVGK